MASTTKKVSFGLLIVTILIASYIYIQSGSDVRFRIDDKKTTIYTFEDSRWKVAGRESSRLFDGTTKLYRNLRYVRVEHELNESSGMLTVRRITPYIRGPIVIDTYIFDSNTTDVTRLPGVHKTEVFGASGLFYRYEVRELFYSGVTFKLDGQTKLKFEKNIHVSLDSGYRWAWVYKSGIVTAQYNVPTDYEVFYNRLYDPLPTVNLTLAGSSEDIKVELGSIINVIANISEGDVCIDIDHPDYGINFICDVSTASTSVNISYFRRVQMNNTNTTENFTFGSHENLTFYINAHQYDEVDNLTINLTGYTNNSTFPAGVKIYVNGSLSNVLGDVNDGSTFTLAEFGDTNTTINASFSQQSTKKIGDFKIPKSATVDTTRINLSGFNATQDAWTFDDGFENQDLIDNLTFTAVGNLSFGQNLDSRIILKDGFLISDNFADAILPVYGQIIKSGTGNVTEDDADGSVLSFNSSRDNDDTAYIQINMTENLQNLEFDFEHYNTTGEANYLSYVIRLSDGDNSRIQFYTEENSGNSSLEDLNIIFHPEGGGTRGWHIPAGPGWSSSWTSCGSFPNRELKTFKILRQDDGTYTIDTGGICPTTDPTTSAISVNKIHIGDKGISDASQKYALEVYINDLLINTKSYPLSGNLTSIEADNATNNTIFNALLTATTSKPTGTDVVFQMTADGTNWENVTSGTTHEFNQTGSTLYWRAFLNGTGNFTPEISNLNIQTNTDTVQQVLNPYLEVGDIDGTREWQYTGTFTEVNNRSANYTDAANDFLTDCTADGDGFCLIPVYLFSANAGVIEVNAVEINYTFDINPVQLNLSLIREFLNSSENFSYIPIDLESNRPGILQVNDVRYDYAGGNQTIKVTVHSENYSSNKSVNMTIYYSAWDFVFPDITNFIEFIPRTSNSTNTTPYGQSDNVSILNITMFNYGNMSANLSLYVNETDVCVNLTISLDNYKANGTQVTNGSFFNITDNRSYLDKFRLWMWADYNCNETTWRLWEPEFHFRSCGIDTICDDDI